MKKVSNFIGVAAGTASVGTMPAVRDRKMSKVAVVYWSGTGNTQACAEAVVDGAKAAGAEVECFSVSEFDVSSTGNYDSVALGCPAMGDEVLEESEFQPAYDEMKPLLQGKKVALFGSYGWGVGDWMNSWKDDAIAAGLTLCTDPVICNEAPDDEAVENLKKLGVALA